MSNNPNDLKEILNKVTKPIILKSFLIVAAVSALLVIVLSSLSNFGILGTAAKVNGNSISLKDFNKNVEAQQKYERDYQKINFSGEEGKKNLSKIKNRVLNQLIEDEVIAQEAKKMGVAISQKDIDEAYQNKAKASGGESKLNELISSYYGYSKEEYKKYIVEPELLRQKLQEKVQTSDEINKEAKKDAENILKQLKDGANFQDMAKKLSQDQASAPNGGDLGWIEKGKMVKEFEDQAFSLKEGEISGVFKTTYGYHIIKVTEKKGEKVHVYQILIKTKPFTEWLSEKVKSAKVEIYITI